MSQFPADEFQNFCNNLRVNTKEQGKIMLGRSLMNSQRRLVSEIGSGLENGVHEFVTLKARQLGISTVSLAFDLYWAGKYHGISGALITHDEPAREQFRTTLEMYYQSLPAGLKRRIRSHNRNQLVFQHGTSFQYKVAGTKTKASGTLGRSSALSFLHATECAFWGNDNDVKSLVSTLAQENPTRFYHWETPLALDTPLPTPDGWTTMGEVRKDDVVFDDHGKPCYVVGLSPVFKDRQCYEIKFSNGDSIVADEKHKWQVQSRKYPYASMYWTTKVVTTKELDIDNHRVAVSMPLQCADVELPIDPYVLGVWLGDGRTDNSVITTGDDDINEIRKHIADRGYSLGKIRKYDWRVGAFTILEQRGLFNRLGLLGHKHIPDIYFRASENQRRELLAGLMDTDGHIEPTTWRCDFSSTLPHLIDQVAELLSSLGIKFVKSQNSKEGQVRLFPSGKMLACSASERLRFTEDPKKKVFNLKRKADVQNNPKREFIGRRAKFLQIVSIKSVPSVPVRCISVDSKSHLFLAGRTMIPTHNTANGFNLFYDMWMEAKNSVTKRAIFIGWWANNFYRVGKDTDVFKMYWGTAGKLTPDERTMVQEVKQLYNVSITVEQMAWYRWYMREKFSDNLLAMWQEMPHTEYAAFVATGSHFFNARGIGESYRWALAQPEPKYYRFQIGLEFVDTEIIRTESKTATLKVWHEPVDGAEYALGADPAFGSSAASNRYCISVWRCYADKAEQVAEFAQVEMSNAAFAWVMVYLASAYGSCIWNLEVNGPGQAVLTELTNLTRQRTVGVESLRTPLNKSMSRIRTYLHRRYDSVFSMPHSIHTLTSAREKERYLGSMRDYFERGYLVIRSTNLIDEMKNLERNEGAAPSASGRNQDDRVIAAALAIIAWNDQLRSRMMTLNQTYAAVAARNPLEVPNEVGPRMVQNMMQRIGFTERLNKPKVSGVGGWVPPK